MSERVAIITGGTGALGRVIVNKFADEGIKVYVPSQSLDEYNKIFDSSKERTSEYFKLRKIFCFECDATNENSVEEFVKAVSAQESGKVDFLVNTVGGISLSSNVDELSAVTLDEMLKLNFMSAFYFTREIVKVMRKNNFGRIISIGAKAGLEPTAGRFAYSVSKAAVINLMDTVSEEMKDFNIRCNTVIPSVIDTPANREWGSPEEIRKWVKPEDISKIIYDFVSDEYSSVRNSHIKVYGSY